MPESSGNNHHSEDISVDVLIVGAGFSGICMGIKLLEAGIKDFLIIEKSDDLGGTWYENRYPGCACDVPAHLYSFSFERNPEWTRMFAGQQEIWQYLKSCVQRYGLAPYIRFGTRFCEAAWDEKAGLWRISAGHVSSGNGNHGDSLTIRARACWYPAWVHCTSRTTRRFPASSASPAPPFIPLRGALTWIWAARPLP